MTDCIFNFQAAPRVRMSCHNSAMAGGPPCSAAIQYRLEAEYLLFSQSINQSSDRSLLHQKAAEKTFNKMLKQGKTVQKQHKLKTKLTAML